MVWKGVNVDVRLITVLPLILLRPLGAKQYQVNSSLLVSFVLIPLSVHMVSPTNPAHGNQTTTIFFFRKKKKPCLCAAEEKFSFWFLLSESSNLTSFYFGVRVHAMCVCLAQRGPSHDTQVKASIEALEERVRTARCPGWSSRAHLTGA